MSVFLSFVVPVLNEEGSLRQLHGEISHAAEAIAGECEVLFIDDGSTDQSWNMIMELARSDGRVRGIRFRRNFGKSAALAAGFGQARGDFLATLDGDQTLLQCVVDLFVRDFPHTLEGLRGGVAREDAPAVAQAAHTLKGMISNFYAGPALTAARRLETISRTGDLTDAGDALASLELELERLSAALQELAGLPGA